MGAVYPFPVNPGAHVSPMGVVYPFPVNPEAQLRIGVLGLVFVVLPNGCVPGVPTRRAVVGASRAVVEASP